MRLASSGFLCSRARLCALCLAVTTACDSPATYHAVDADDGGSGPAPGRRAVAVIADFAGARLEDWQGAGFADLAQVRAQLAAMTAHWRFLRRGLETIGWTVVRVQLPQAVTDDAFASASDFRDAVVELARSKVVANDYDFDRDGVIDSVWIIAASNGHVPRWLAAGISRDAGANVFVDAQDSERVQAGMTGDFNHDVALTRGLRDLHGDHNNVGDLSLMSNSWIAPPNDFSAFDRLHLGWLTPRLVAIGPSTVDIADANEALVAFEVTTAQPDEYFLLEYRRPAGGIVVYHVLETSDQTRDPPLLKVETVAGAGAAPVTLRAYGGNPVFTLDAVRSGPAGSLEADLTVDPLAQR